MSKNPPAEFVFLSVEAFRKLTPYEKQKYVEELKQHLDAPIRALREEQSSHSPEL